MPNAYLLERLTVKFTVLWKYVLKWINSTKNKYNVDHHINRMAIRNKERGKLLIYIVNWMANYFLPLLKKLWKAKPSQNHTIIQNNIITSSVNISPISHLQFCDVTHLRLLFYQTNQRQLDIDLYQSFLPFHIFNFAM